MNKHQAYNSNERKRNNAEQLFKKYGSLMFIVAKSILHDDYEAEDAVMEAFRNLWEKDKLPDVEGSTAKAFMAVVAKNSALNMARKDRQLLEGDFDEFIQNRQSATDDSDDISRVSAAVADLPEDLRELLILRYYIGYSVKEIAAAKGEKENTLFVKISRAKDLLKKILEEES